MFLSQDEYTKQCGRSPMTDFRRIYKADFELIYVDETDDWFRFVLQAVKPARLESSH